MTNEPTSSRSVSVVVPAYNEAPSLPILFKEIETVCIRQHYDFEVIFVNDGSTDDTEGVLAALFRAHPDSVRVISLAGRSGKARALSAGFAAAKSNIIITMDGDLQDDPKEIPRFVNALDRGYDLVSGWKYERKDSFIKNQTSKVYNFVTSAASGIWLHDHNCGFKAYRAVVARTLPLNGQLHRFIPLLAKANGFRKITELTVHHRVRSYGESKYGVSRFLYGITGLVEALRIASTIRNGELGYFPLPEYKYTLGT